MIIVKNNVSFAITEFSNCWKIIKTDGKLQVVFEISKDLCPNEIVLKDYILSNDMF